MRDIHLYQYRCVPAAALLLLATTAYAQATASDEPPAARATWREARILGSFVMAAASAMPADRAVQRAMQRRWVQDSPILSQTADSFNAYGSPGVLAGSALLFAGGWVGGRTDVARWGLRTLESIAFSGVVTGGIKGLAGRARPSISQQRPGDWRLLSGADDRTRQSFPSGHATAAFAFAAAMNAELRHARSAKARWAGRALYAAATLTSLARLHADEHWASDVIMGAGIGTVSGLMVARFHSGQPAHWIDRWLLPRDDR